jgi:dipeptidyl aminopeptidase/acylaminoacyl peptidase
MAVDVLNLIALIKSGSGPEELLTTAAPDNIGLWGHSMGGNISLRVLTSSQDVKAAVLFASLGGNEIQNSEMLFNATSDPVFQTELSASPAILEHISPMYYYRDITSPIQIQHGTADEVVLVAWAEETCAALVEAGVQVECIYYPEEGHTFRSGVIEQVNEAMFRFYRMYLSS